MNLLETKLKQNDYMFLAMVFVGVKLQFSQNKMTPSAFSPGV